MTGGNYPYAKGVVHVAVWRNRRGDGSQYLAIDIGSLGRFEADVLPEGTRATPGRGVPYAQGRGVVVWRGVRHRADGDEVYLQIKHTRFRNSFRAYLTGDAPLPAAPPRWSPGPMLPPRKV